MYKWLETGAGFSSGGYFGSFAPHFFTLPRGYRELESLLLLDPRFTSVEHIRACIFAERFLIQDAVRPDWKKVVGKRGQWSDCHWVQVVRLGSGHPMRLDQLIQALLALARLFATSEVEELRALKVFDYMKLLPQTYALEIKDVNTLQFMRGTQKSTMSQWQAMVCKLYGVKNELMQEQTDNARDFLADAVSYYPMTWHSANIISTCLQEYKLGFTVHPLKKRTDAARRVTEKGNKEIVACRWESRHIGLSEKQVANLEGLKAAIESAQAGRG